MQLYINENELWLMVTQMQS